MHFHSRKSIWKCPLENGGHFVSASMCKVKLTSLKKSWVAWLPCPKKHKLIWFEGFVLFTAVDILVMEGCRVSDRHNIEKWLPAQSMVYCQIYELTLCSLATSYDINKCVICSGNGLLLGTNLLPKMMLTDCQWRIWNWKFQLKYIFMQ